jgi:[ribosomal protein S18]-alanine N-acetyltransferase
LFINPQCGRGVPVVSFPVSRDDDPARSSPVSCTKSLSPAEEPDGHAAAARRARPEEIPLLVELDRTCFASRAWSLRAWREVVLLPEWTTLVVVRGEGLAAASVFLAGAPVSWLASLAVHPSRRRTGLGRMLLRDALERARHASSRWLSLEVDRANRAAVTLYRREGFGVLARFCEEGRWRQEMIHRLGGGRGV